MVQEQKRFALAFSILLLSSIVAINLLLENPPVVIQLEGDTFRVVDIPYVYTVKEAYILLFSGFLSGLALAQILYSLRLSSSFFPLRGPVEPVRAVNLSADSAPKEKFEEFSESISARDTLPARPDIDSTDILLRVLEGDEKKAVELIAAKGGRILQNELVNSLDFSKAKVSRVLMSLERRGIITKKKYGLTNCISIAEELMINIGVKGGMK